MPRPKNKEEYRKEMAEAFAHVLEEKGLNWRKDWQSDHARNGVTNVGYKGMNQFWLSLIAVEKEYKDPRWVTMVQIMDKDGKYHPGEKWHLKAGSHAEYVEYWFPYDKRAKKFISWKEYKEEYYVKERPSTEFQLCYRLTPVFNASLVEGMPKYEYVWNPEFKADEILEKISTNMNVPIINDSRNAFYSVGEDIVHMPSREKFHSEYGYNSTALHELSHATGHESRLNRDGNYAYEELVAEMSSCFMSANIKTEITEEHIENHKAYVQGWANAIREQPEMLINAIKDAQDATSFLEWKAEIITTAEYQQRTSKVIERPAEEISQNRELVQDVQRPIKEEEAVVRDTESRGEWDRNWDKGEAVRSWGTKDTSYEHEEALDR